MNKAELVKAIAEKAQTTKLNAEKCLNAFIEAIKEALRNNEEVRLVGFGTFKVTNRKERKGRNPKTGEEITIPAKKAVKFVPRKELKEAVE